MVQGILVVNTETIPGMMITETLGVVSGSTVRAKNIGRDITQGLRNNMGGELVKYNELLEESRQESIGRMVADAMSRGATAIVNVRLATSAVTAGAAELFHAPDGTGFADISVDGHRETWPVRSAGFRRWIRCRFFGWCHCSGSTRH